jgi:hypothetical protein
VTSLFPAILFEAYGQFRSSRETFSSNPPI